MDGQKRGLVRQVWGALEDFCHVQLHGRCQPKIDEHNTQQHVILSLKLKANEWEGSIKVNSWGVVCMHEDLTGMTTHGGIGLGRNIPGVIEMQTRIKTHVGVVSLDQ